MGSEVLLRHCILGSQERGTDRRIGGEQRRSKNEKERGGPNRVHRGGGNIRRDEWRASVSP